MYNCSTISLILLTSFTLDLLKGHLGHLKLMMMFKHLHGVLYGKRILCVITTLKLKVHSIEQILNLCLPCSNYSCKLCWL